MVFFIYCDIIPSLSLYAGIAQLVEHMSRKHEAMSSILIASTILNKTAVLFTAALFIDKLVNYGII